MGNFVVTPEIKDAAGDVLLEIIVRGGSLAHVRDLSLVPGDLVVEVSTMFGLDWERVGYLLSITEEPYPPEAGSPGATEKVYRVWSVCRRVVTWRNASFRRVDFWPGPVELRSFPRPTEEDLAKDHGDEPR